MNCTGDSIGSPIPLAFDAIGARAAWKLAQVRLQASLVFDRPSCDTQRRDVARGSLRNEGPVVNARKQAPIRGFIQLQRNARPHAEWRVARFIYGGSGGG